MSKLHLLRCPDCKHTFVEPEDGNGNTPAPLESIECPECKELRVRMFYIDLGEHVQTENGPFCVEWEKMEMGN